jgi:branched-chain amino acid transport system permease protein
MAAQRLREGVWPPVALAVAIVVVAALAGATGDVVIRRVAILALINLVLVVGLWTFSGVTGVVSFGHVSFAAIGAYACAYLTIPVAMKRGLFPEMPGFLDFLLTVHASFPVAVVLSGLAAAVFALVVAPAFVRLDGVQAGIATLALLAVVYNVLLNWEEVTRGSSTMIGVPADLRLGTAAVWAVAAVAIAWLFARSRVGLRARAAREDGAAARSLGLRVVADRTVAWCLSAFVVGCGGALYAHFITTFNPDQFYLGLTFVLLAMLVLGGIGSLTGAVVGVAVYSLLAELLRRLQGGSWTGVELPAGTAEVVLAALLLVMLIKRPRGLTGGREVPWPARRGPRAAAAAPPAPRPGAAEGDGAAA